MNKVISIVVIGLGIVLGLYLGLWVMFIGGILGIASAIDGGTVTATIIALNIVKIVLASLVGYIIITVSFLLGGIIDTK